jgi:hypothetical protein
MLVSDGFRTPSLYGWGNTKFQPSCNLLCAFALLVGRTPLGSVIGGEVGGWIYIRDMNMHLNYSPSPVATTLKGRTPKSAVRYCPRNITHSIPTFCICPAAKGHSNGANLSYYLRYLSPHTAYVRGWMTRGPWFDSRQRIWEFLEGKTAGAWSWPFSPWYAFTASESTTWLYILIYWTHIDCFGAWIA